MPPSPSTLLSNPQVLQDAFITLTLASLLFVTYRFCTKSSSTTHRTTTDTHKQQAQTQASSLSLFTTHAADRVDREEKEHNHLYTITHDNNLENKQHTHTHRHDAVPLEDGEEYNTAAKSNHKDSADDKDDDDSNDSSSSSSRPAEDSSYLRPVLTAAEREKRRQSYLPKTRLQGGLGKTALFVAAGRATEQQRDQADRLFNDPFAEHLAGEYGMKMLAAIAEQLNTDGTLLANYIAIRTRYFDDQIIAAINNNKSSHSRTASASASASLSPLKPVSPTSSSTIRQLVILCVGSDTRSLRLPLPADVTVFELDTEEVLVFRDEKIEEETDRLGGEQAMPSLAIVKPVYADITVLNTHTQQARPTAATATDSHAWMQALLQNGFDRDKPSLFVLEGVLMFLPDRSVDLLISQLSSLCVSGSRVLCDMYNAEYYRHADMKPVLDVWERWGARPLSGNNLPEAVWGKHQFSAQVLQYGQEWAVDYGRIEQKTKDHYLKENLRGSTNDWPRQWIIRATKN